MLYEPFWCWVNGVTYFLSAVCLYAVVFDEAANLSKELLGVTLLFAFLSNFNRLTIHIANFIYEEKKKQAEKENKSDDSDNDSDGDAGNGCYNGA
jgi:uncharacterized membrane protein